MENLIRIEDFKVLDEHAQQWDDALELWLSSRHSINTRRAYAHAVQDLLKVSGRAIWELGRADLARWVGNMHVRGLSENTISQRLAAVSSFYKFAMTEIIMHTDWERKEVPLCQYNPAAGKDLRPKVSPYGRASYFGTAEARALLKAIDRGTVRGQRDYALILGYLFTGRRNSEWRVARWGDFEVRGGRVRYCWNGKGKTNQHEDIAPPVWNALVSYVQATGRTHIQPGEYLFVPLTRSALNLPNVSADHWNSNHPITAKEVGRVLKVYARKAGLDPRKVKVHMLRHTAAMLRKEAGDDIQQICEFLGHSNVAITQIYVHTLEGKSDESWNTVASFLGL